MATLSELATTIRREHELAFRSAVNTLEHAIAAGEALLEARESVIEGEWQAWVTANTTIHFTVAGRYMRLATYRDVLAERKPKSLNAAIEFLRDIEAPAIRSGGGGKKPTFNVEEARRLRDAGMTYREIAALVGVSDVAVSRQLTPGSARKATVKAMERKSKQRAEQREVNSQQVVAEVAQAGGSLANAYLLLRQCSAELEQAVSNAETAELRKFLDTALTYSHRAEDAILRALGIEHQRRR